MQYGSYLLINYMVKLTCLTLSDAQGRSSLGSTYNEGGNASDFGI